MGLTEKIASGIFAAIILGVILVNSKNTNQVISGIGTFSTNTTRSLTGVKPISGGY